MLYPKISVWIACPRNEQKGIGSAVAREGFVEFNTSQFCSTGGITNIKILFTGSGSGQPSGDNPHVPVVENVPHLLWTLKNYIDRLNAGALSTQTLPVVCTHPPAMNPGQRQASLFGQEIQALTASICSVLDSTDLPEALRSQLESAQQGIDSSSDHNENVRFSPWPNPSIISPGDLATAQPYAHLPLLVAALGHLTSRADTLFRERASRSLRNACQQLQAATEVDESNQELLVVSSGACHS